MFSSDYEVRRALAAILENEIRVDDELNDRLTATETRDLRQDLDLSAT